MGFSLKTTIEEISPNEVHAKFIAALLRVSSHENINSFSNSSNRCPQANDPEADVDTR